ncbi:uncharacterized protein [Periplaneta americana]|uniref:uncharacterized protein isoform X1 n=1 Tax=Periplaneta americana TaxID=6978 RepID=UPI0037E995B7
MATAQSLVDALPRYGVMLALVLVLATSGQGSTPVPASLQSREHKTPAWWPLLQCVLLADFNKCLQDRTLRAFVGLGKNDELRIDPVKGTVKLPGEREEGIYDMLGDIVSDGISRLFQDDDDEDEDTKRSGKQEVEEDEEDDEDGVHALESAEHGDDNRLSGKVSVDGNVQRSVETGRGKKKKKERRRFIRRMIIKFVLTVLLIKLKFAKLMYMFGKFLQFKMVMMITINTIINVMRFIKEWRKKDDKKVHYSFEQAHHQHLYDEAHHVDHPWMEDTDHKGGWFDGIISRSNNAQDIAYRAQKPDSHYYTQNPAQPTGYHTIQPSQKAAYQAQRSNSRRSL